MDVKIRKEETSDHAKVYEVNRRAFGQENESRLVEKIRKGRNFVPELSLVAEVGGEVVGHILFSKIKIIGESVFEALTLAPLAVLPGFQGRGIGGELVRAGLEKARGLGFGSVILLGHEKYYPRFGFKRASGWGLRCPFAAPDGAFMAIELTEKALANKSGTIELPEEFNEC